MAIAGVLLTVPKEDQDLVGQALEAIPEVVQFAPTPDNAQIQGLALVLECPAKDLTKRLEDLGQIPGVLDVGLTYAEYSDDLD